MAVEAKMSVDGLATSMGIPTAVLAVLLDRKGIEINDNGTVDQAAVTGILLDALKRRNGGAKKESKFENRPFAQRLHPPSVKRAPVKEKKRAKKRKNNGRQKVIQSRRLDDMMEIVMLKAEKLGFEASAAEKLPDEKTKHAAFVTSTLHGPAAKLRLLCHVSKRKSKGVSGYYNFSPESGVAAEKVWRLFYVDGLKQVALMSDAELAKRANLTAKTNKEGVHYWNVTLKMQDFFEHGVERKLNQAFKAATGK